MNDLLSKVLTAIKDREGWAQRQALWYTMRHAGVRRRNKPYGGAADLHLPLVDSAINKLKPFYVSQIFGAASLCQFLPLDPDLRDVADACSEAMDWKLREESNFPKEIISAIDYMLLRGRGVLKHVFDSREDCLSFKAVDPLYMILPKHAAGLQEADWFAEVRHLSIGEFKRNPFLMQDALNRVRGNQADTQGNRSLEQEKVAREGLTYSDDPDLIILWEIYSRDADGGYTITTISPTAPGVKVREPFRLPYRYRGKPCLPFTDFPLEVKDAGWYSSRGLAEIIGAFEMYGSKVWNMKADLLDFAGKPLLTGTNALVNPGNIRFNPGDYIAGDVKGIQFPPPPVDLGEEMASTRSVAEQAVAIPDFGVGGAASPAGNKTATEVDYMRSLASVGVDLRGQVLRISLRNVYQCSWGLLVQYAEKQISYFVGKTAHRLPEEAIVDSYMVFPDGTPDAWNKIARVQAASARYQALKGHPNVNQEELVRDLLSAQDGRLVNRLVISTTERAGSESKDEALEIMLMEGGFPVQARPDQDHVTRIKILFGKLEQLAMLRRPIDPMFKNLMHAHIAQHIALLKQQNPHVARQLTEALAGAEQQAAPGLPPGAGGMPAGPAAMPGEENPSNLVPMAAGGGL